MAAPAVSEISSYPFQDWQAAYQLAVAETNRIALFKCIEVAQARLLMRRDALENCANCQAEQRAIADALNHLRRVKKITLNFIC